MDRLAMSLDDVIAQKEKNAASSSNNRNAKKNGAARGASRGPPKKTNFPRDSARDDRPRKLEVQNASRTAQVASNRQNLSVFARIGKPPVSGTRVTFANLKSSVAEKDIEDLCGAVGEVKEVELISGRSGRNTAIVLFARRSDALTCVTKLNGMTLDGFPMEVSVTGEPAEFTAPKSVFDRLQPAQQNVRAGLFGTAMDFDDNDNDASSSGPSFSVTLGGNTDGFGRQTKIIQPFAVGSNAPKSIVQPFAAPRKEKDHSGEGPRFLYRDETDEQQPSRGIRQPFDRSDRGQNNNSNTNNRRSNNNRPRDNGPRGGKNSNSNRNKGSQRAERQAKPAPTATDLDADLDAYFSK